MKPKTPDAEIASRGHSIPGRRAAGAGCLPARQPLGAQRQVAPSLADHALMNAAAVDAHMKRQQGDGLAVAANARFKSVPIGLDSRAVMGRQAPLSGPPHTLPPRPLQTTASCRQSMQNPTP
jgi:hypothetical protein